jgi:hypothetical protein
VLAACDHGSVHSCADDIHGVYTTPANERWMLLDNGNTLEAYPMFDDSHGPAEVVTAPRVIDVVRDGTHLAGTLSRRTMRRADSCIAKAPFHVVACTAAGIDVVVGDVAPPVAFAPCAFPPPLPSRAEHWRRD